MATWDWDLERGTFARSEGMAALYGLPPGALAGPTADPLGLVHPEDRGLIEEMDRRHLEEGAPYDVEYRIVRPDGQLRWLREVGRKLPDPGGGRGRLLGVTMDVTARKDAEDALRRSEIRHRALVEQLPAFVYVTPAGGPPLTYISPQVEGVLGYPPADWLDDPDLWPAILHPDDRRLALEEQARSLLTGEDFALEYRVVARDGRVVWLRDEARLVHDADGRPLYRQGLVVDITDRKEAEAALRRSEAEFRLVFASNPHPMWVYDRETLRFLEVNEAAVAHYGYARDEFLAMTVADIRPADDVGRLRTQILAERAPLERAGEWRHRLKDGRIVDVEITSHRLTFRDRPATLVVAVDVTERKALAAQLAHQAFHDPLTGLPNRALFLDRLGHTLRRVANRPQSVAVLFLDLDDFKLVNDTLGHRTGDELLVAVAERLRGGLRTGDTIARFGGDEFTFLLEGLAGPEDAERIAERIAEELRPPVNLAGRDVFLTCSVGIAVPRSPADRAEDLLRSADVALYDAKRRGRARYALFEPAMDAHAWNRLEMEAELRQAIAEEQLRLHYQPLVALADGRVAEVEALVRWEHPARGLILPDDFIPLAEATGLVVPLGRWVLRRACHQVREWQLAFPRRPPLGVAVNLSARQLQAPDLVADVANALAESGLEPACLKLEITETVAMVDIVGTSLILRALKALGVRLAIDDFGAGYSGLSYLKRCPVDALKIDRAYVAGLGHEASDEAMIRAFLAFARTLGLSVTAEGVETAEQLAHLLTLGCERGQGFFFARPAPPEAIAELLADGEESRAAPALAATA